MSSDTPAKTSKAAVQPDRRRRKKSALGVKPRGIHRIHRCQDLIQALYRTVTDGSGPDPDLMEEWAAELAELLQQTEEADWKNAAAAKSSLAP